MVRGCAETSQAVALSIVILAAGEGRRMRSRVPKVLHTLAGCPLLEHVCRAAGALAHRELYVVYGNGGEAVRERMAGIQARWVLQERRLGTGDAVACALAHIPEADRVLVLCGDVPLLRPATLERLLSESAEDGLGLLAALPEDPSGYGRILRDAAGRPLRIVEERDAEPEQRAIREVYGGVLVAPAAALTRWLRAMASGDNAQGERYLTDAVAAAVAEARPIAVVFAEDAWELAGVNDRIQLARLERRYQRRQANELMAAGVTLADPDRFDLRGRLNAGCDVTIDVNAVLEGEVRIGDGVSIGANCVIRDSVIGANTVLLPNCYVEQAAVGARCRLGPFCRIRPETQLGDETQIGNFVEIKKASIGSRTRINHLSYVGDATVGTDVNVGCGTVTCNYDGARKHRTVIEDGVFIGSDTQLIAPVRVGRDATVAAGTTVTHDVEPEVLAIGRARQRIVRGWKRPGRS